MGGPVARLSVLFQRLSFCPNSVVFISKYFDNKSWYLVGQVLPRSTFSKLLLSYSWPFALPNPFWEINFFQIRLSSSKQNKTKHPVRLQIKCYRWIWQLHDWVFRFIFFCMHVLMISQPLLDPHFLLHSPLQPFWPWLKHCLLPVSYCSFVSLLPVLTSFKGLLILLFSVQKVKARDTLSRKARRWRRGSHSLLGGDVPA